MEQYTENQYDDDLTIGSEEYDDSYYTGAEDLFDVPMDEESPISRLKSLILSIDWEITDEVLLLFNEELVNLRETWAGEKINLVYVQALEKISKYIYYKKADSHPSAIKLLLTLYHNLEKIVSSQDLSEEQKKEILFEDVKRFEQLKAHITKEGAEAPEEPDYSAEEEIEDTTQQDELRNLKAIVLGIDWEITDEDLNDLSEEVVRLEQVFAGNKPRLILLQGIGTIGAYIKLKKSDTHAEAFKVLHLFFESLEKIVSSPLSLDEEKEVLFPAVEKFNSFKTLIGSTITAEAIAREEQTHEELAEEGLEPEDDFEDTGVITPAFADLPEDEVHGFQADEEAQALGYESPDDVVSHVADFFPDEAEQKQPDTVSLETSEDEMVSADELAALSDQLEPDSFEEEIAQSLEQQPEDKKEIGTSELAGPESTTSEAFSEVDAELALQGVDVETEADDDSDEETLPQIDGELAPALSLGDEDLEEEIEPEKLADVSGVRDESDDIEGAIADFFGDDDVLEEPAAPSGSVEEQPVAPLKAETPSPGVAVQEEETAPDLSEEVAPVAVDKEIALQGVDVETEADDDSDEVPLPTQGDEIAPALALEDDFAADDKAVEEAAASSEDEALILDTVDDFFDEVDEPAQSPEAALTDADDDLVFTQEIPSTEESEEISDFVERLDNFFDEAEPDETVGLESMPVAGEAGETDELVAALSGLDVDEDGEQFELDEEEEVIFELVEDDDLLDLAEVTLLQDFVGSLGTGQDETALRDLGLEVDKLSAKCSDRPVDLALLKVVSSLAEKYGDLSNRAG